MTADAFARLVLGGLFWLWGAALLAAVGMWAWDGVKHERR